MLSTILISTADSGINRIDAASLPHADLFTLLTENVDLPDGWSWLKSFDTMDNMLSVIISRPRGHAANPVKPPLSTVDFRYVPSTVANIDWTGLYSTGTVETSHLPENLEIFEIGKNRFFGSFSTDGLPKKIIEVNIYENDFEGLLHLETLPPRVKAFRAYQNHFSGNLNFSALPSGIVFLCLEMNEFTGRVHVHRIPPSLKYLSLHKNLWGDDIAFFNDRHTFSSVSINKKFKGRTMEERFARPFTPANILFI